MGNGSTELIVDGHWSPLTLSTHARNVKILVNKTSKMVAELTLGIWNSNQLRRIPFDNVDLDDKVEKFKSDIIKKLNGKDDIELTYCGIILEDENTLSSYGVTPGVVIFALEKKKEEVEVKQSKVSGDMKLNPPKNIRNVLQKISRKDILDKIIDATPGLKNDPVALAIVQDPDLLLLLSERDTMKKVAESHPVLIEAANYIFKHIQDDGSSNPHQAGTSSGYSYSLEALSDDDDLDSDTNMGPHSLTRNSSFNAITAAQLAAAIANATNTAFNSNSAGIPTTPSGSSLITNEMFSSAMQQAFSSSPFGGEQSFPQTPQNDDNVTRRLQPQLQQMHEMGLVNDAVNVRALQVTGGDVQAAIELVFNGAVE